MGRKNRTAPRAQGTRSRRIITRVNARTVASLAVVAFAPITLIDVALATDVGPRTTLPAHFSQLLPPAQLESASPAADPAQIGLLRRFEDDDLRVTGYVASRNGAEAADYRVYVGVRYKSELGSLANITSRAFYGSGTYDGLDCEWQRAARRRAGQQHDAGQLAGRGLEGGEHSARRSQILRGRGSSRAAAVRSARAECAHGQPGHARSRSTAAPGRAGHAERRLPRRATSR